MKLAVRPRVKAETQLDKRGKANVTAEVTSTPDGGSANTEANKVKLRKQTPSKGVP